MQSYSVSAFDSPKLPSDLKVVVGDAVFLSDIVVILISGLAAFYCYIELCRGYTPVPTGSQFTDYMRFTIISSLVLPVFLRDRQLGATAHILTTLRMLRLLATRLALVICGVLALAFFTRSFGGLSRIWLVTFTTLTLVTTGTSRAVLLSHAKRSGWRGAFRDVIALVGSGSLADCLVDRIRARSAGLIDVAGVFDDVPHDHAPGPYGLAGSLDDLIELCRKRVVDRVIVTFSASQELRLESLVRRLKALDVEVTLCPQMVGAFSLCERLELLDGIPVIVLANRPIRSWGRVAKMLEDRFLGGLLLVAVLPVFAIVALLVYIGSPGPVFFRQRRHGWNNTEFEVFKFRTMTWQRPSDSPIEQTKRNDKRVTRFGRFLRRSSLDELPQLLNVLLGEMSLVGPRPHPVTMRTEDQLGDEIIAEYAHRHRVKPGITGWAQVNGCRGATETVDQVRERVRYDLEYIENWSILFDLKILVMTPLQLVLGRNAF